MQFVGRDGKINVYRTMKMEALNETDNGANYVLCTFSESLKGPRIAPGRPRRRGAEKPPRPGATARPGASTASAATTS